MFKQSQSQTYTWPVTFELPASGGKFEKHTFDAEFKRLPQSRLREIQTAGSEAADDVTFAQEILVGWKGVQDESGQEVPFSVGARDAVLDVPGVATAVVLAFIQSIHGGKRKN